MLPETDKTAEKILKQRNGARHCATATASPEGEQEKKALPRDKPMIRHSLSVFLPTIDPVLILCRRESCLFAVKYLEDPHQAGDTENLINLLVRADDLNFATLFGRAFQTTDQSSQTR